jgi:hypothetical protein
LTLNPYGCASAPEDHHELAQDNVRLIPAFGYGKCVGGGKTDPNHSLSAAVGTQEPIYGPEAIRSVAQQTAETPYTVLNKDLLRWKAFQYTNVETQTFYVMADNGTLVMVQVIYSNIA